MSEPSWVAELVRAVQQPRHAFGLLVACGVCLILGLLPVLQPTLQPGRAWFLFGALLSGGLLLWDIGVSLIRAFREQAEKREALARLKDLTKAERSQLAHWLKEDIRSGNLSTDGVVASLVDRGIMVEVQNSRNRVGLATFVIREHIWNHLKRNPSLVSQ